MNRMNKNKGKKYIVGGATAVAVAIASCGAGLYADRSVTPDSDTEYMAAAAVGEATEMTASTSDADLIETLSSGVSVEEKDIYKDETVYVFADANGNTNSILVSEKLNNADGSATLIDKTDLSDIENVKGDETYTIDGDTITWNANGNDICYQGTSDKDLPVDVEVTYYLDGEEISPDELAGQSGSVKIRFDYTNNETVEKEINGEDETISVPFVAVSGMVLGESFTNIEVENGKIMEEGDSNIVVGYAMPGLQDSLDIDDSELSGDISFPDYFQVTADVTDFSMDMTVTLVINGSAMNLAGEIDMSELDDMVDSLTDASSELAEGTGTLSDGVDTLLSKMGEFSSGVSTLQSGLNSLANGSSSLASGVDTINQSAQSISAAIGTLNTALNTAMTDEEKESTMSQASTAAQAAVETQFDNGQYDTIKSQAETAYTATMTSDETINMIYQGLRYDSTTGGDSTLYTSLLAAGYQSAAQTAMKNAIAAGGSMTLEAAMRYVQTTESYKSQVASSVEASLKTMASSIASGIATNGADAIGTSMADACETAAKTAAGSAAGAAAVAGAEAAKAQISAEINATQSNGYSLVTGAQALAEGTNTLATNLPTLTDGVSKLLSGVNSLVSGTSQLTDGVSELADGAETLDDGMNQFNEEAIEELASAYNGDLKKLTGRINAVLEASTEYDTFTGLNDGDAGTTKFIIKTDGISVE